MPRIYGGSLCTKAKTSVIGRSAWHCADLKIQLLTGGFFVVAEFGTAGLGPSPQGGKSPWSCWLSVDLLWRCQNFRDISETFGHVWGCIFAFYIEAQHAEGGDKPQLLGVTFQGDEIISAPFCRLDFNQLNGSTDLKDMEEQLQLARRELEACTQLCRSQMALSFMFLTCKAEKAEKCWICRNDRNGIHFSFVRERDRSSLLESCVLCETPPPPLLRLISP